MFKTADDRFTLHISRKQEYLFFVLLFGLAVFLRFLYLSADPPEGISLSTAIETDPPGHTVFARSAVLTGDWNPYLDNRFITYQYSLISGFAWVIYKLFGVGVYQTNLAAVIMSLLAIFLFYLVLRKSNGNGVALLMLFFIGINYLMIFIGRRPLLENGMNLLIVMSLFCLTYGEKRGWGHFLFGFFAAAAIVFGKVLALAFLAAPAVYYLYKIAVLKDKRGYGQAVIFSLGFILLAAAWYFLVYAPNASSVSGYMMEQVFGLHGSPEAFDSFSRFIWKFLVFGMKDFFFERLPAISIASLFFIILISSRLFSRGRDEKSAPYKNLVLITIVVWQMGIYIGEVPWNYQPLRYLTAMIFPMAALTAVLIAYLYNLKKPANLFNRSIAFIVIAFILLLRLIYQVAARIAVTLGYEFTFKDSIIYLVGAVFLGCFVYFLIAGKKGKWEIVWPRYFRYSLIGVIIVASAYFQINYYLTWAKVPLYTMRQASRDLGLVLSPGAVISGPYGPAMVLENQLGAVVHYFGTTRPDPDLFRRFPVTHLALDVYNEEVARQIYPEIMEKADLVCNYNINCDKVSIFNIAPYTGNRQAAAYRPSDFEKSAAFRAIREPDSAAYYLIRYLNLHPDNIVGNTQAGLYFMAREDYKNAAQYFERASQYSATDFKLHFFLGNAYTGYADKSGDESFREMGRAEIESARKYSLGKYDLDEKIIKDPKDRENGISDKK